jgi:hypothetical protein
MTFCEKPAKFSKKLKTKSARKTTVRIFQITLERGRAAAIVKGGGNDGFRMTGGGVSGDVGGELPGGAPADSGVGGSSSIMNEPCHKPRQRASANTIPMLKK